ncbi:hypothetical protein GV819_27220 [Pseudomonas sp. Fl5BN2]|uniref:hypothetical protein n=1 Tax=Pseudomonas sp. Fl5BN2 TaxID=2697652 RepID=UPI00137749FC|nr:hypothetical protein [Pseudomonas sp. Fl5BN2]NBF05987.1 hypothetical protein [Pseudomonas sp. Fl5BN2]
MPHYSNDKDIARLVKQQLPLGWLFHRGKRHGKLSAPGKGSIPVPCTPSDCRALLNFRLMLRRLECL